MTGPRWIKQWINNLAALNELFRDDDGKVDFEALGREEYQFRQALVTHKFAKSERAKEAYQQAMTAYSANVANGKKGGRPKKSPQDAPNGNAGVDVSDAGNGAASKSPTSCDQFTADGDTREDSRGRYAPPSCSPEDGNPAETAPSHGGSVASLEARHGQALVSRRTGGCGTLEKPNSQKSPQPSLFPVAKPEKRRYGMHRHVLLTDDEGLKLRESLGEDLEDAVAILDEYIQSLPVKAKGAKKNGAKWWMQEYEAKDHYIVLHHGWARKRLNEMRTEELNARAAELRYSAAETNAKAAEKRLENVNSSSQPRQMYLTSDDISRRNAEEGWRQLQLMHQTEGNG